MESGFIMKINSNIKTITRERKELEILTFIEMIVNNNGSLKEKTQWLLLQERELCPNF